MQAHEKALIDAMAANGQTTNPESDPKAQEQLLMNVAKRAQAQDTDITGTSDYPPPARTWKTLGGSETGTDLEAAFRAQLLGTASTSPESKRQDDDLNLRHQLQEDVVQTQSSHQLDQGVPIGLGVGSSASPPSDGDGAASAGSRGSKRELSTSKRAAQNRAAQRAFRQRKEEYIKDLEGKVRDYSTMAEAFKSVQEENNTLRSYIIQLQSRIIDTQGVESVPGMPAGINMPTPTLSTTPHVPGSEAHRRAEQERLAGSIKRQLDAEGTGEEHPHSSKKQHTEENGAVNGSVAA